MTQCSKNNYTTLLFCGVILLASLFPSVIFAKPDQKPSLIVANSDQAPDYRRLNFQLFDACKEGNVKLITKLLKQGASVKARNRFGNTALFYAARSGNLEAVKILLNSIDEDEMIYNKKAIYLYLRELTGLNTKQVVNNLNKLRVRYRIFKKNWINGKI